MTDYADYKKMYLHLCHETERALQILIAAQQECEKLLLDASEGPRLLPAPPREDGGVQP